MENPNALKELKKQYSELQKKYKLPKFEELNIYFDIERAADKQTDLLLREVRRHIAEKVYIYVKFCEMILNPSTAPMFMFSSIKNLSSSDRKIVEEIYKQLSQVDIDIMELDLNYSEKKEAEFVISLTKEWKKINEKLLYLMKVFRGSPDTISDRNNKGYFS